MSHALAAFYAGLHREHLDTGGFLYESWELTLKQPCLDLARLAELEQRLEAHVDALVLAGEAALPALREAHGGEPGARYLAARTLCRLGQAGELRDLMTALGEAGPAEQLAVLRGLDEDMPTAWSESLGRNLGTAEPALRPFYLRLAARRRLALPADWPIWWAESADCREALAFAAGRMPGADAVLERLAAGEASGGLARAMARAGRLSDVLRVQPPPHPEALLHLAIAGSEAAFDTLAGQSSQPAALVALGLLGDTRALPLLLSLLPEPALGGAAAWGLRLITGLAPWERVFLPEAVQPALLFPEEGRRYHELGEVPRSADGRPFGQNVERLSRDPTRWREAMPAFTPGLRYRAGQPATPGALLAPLIEAFWPQELRRLALDELAARHGWDGGGEADMPVQALRRRQDAWRQELEALPHSAGAWHTRN
ncbi:MAG: hypothetical protein HYV16_03315 [Gammaproteobacteria bacterium]|nr:hypothetical protein [Gammaproteobacteria bacterium]